MMKAGEVEGCRAGGLGGSGMFWVLGEGGVTADMGGGWLQATPWPGGTLGDRGAVPEGFRGEVLKLSSA